MDYEKSFIASLRERRLEQDNQSVSPKRMIAYQIERAMAQQGVNRVDMAERMGTSRAALNRLLDPENQSVTLQTIETAAQALGLEIVIHLNKQETSHV